ncbi:MAG: hypothetical protein JW932_19110 [Deltaproteobacteria bacterium]|nr:hypothetical protein [Deltaproteobacteria bacterium]
MRKVKNGFIKNLYYICLVGVIALGLMMIVGAGCGGGSKESSPPSSNPQKGSIWDEMYWDLGNWA